ncbi:unnamed protein product [Pleuronectes platessa]|uniref:Uncharacterized protein n=1 Tax=Pleuronectes platessa TaxID=8262 RepID=A0A9N7TZF9_PLEPL|nr:unnamed protein product [Pleuronectes platessa]
MRAQADRRDQADSGSVSVSSFEAPGLRWRSGSPLKVAAVVQSESVLATEEHSPPQRERERGSPCCGAVMLQTSSSPIRKPPPPPP